MPQTTNLQAALNSRINDSAAIVEKIYCTNLSPQVSRLQNCTYQLGYILTNEYNLNNNKFNNKNEKKNPPMSQPASYCSELLGSTVFPCD
jgi:hypothetical protein